MGPMALAGFTPAPLMGPLMRMAAASAAPMATAAAPRGTLLSVVTAVITRTGTKVTTASEAKTRPRPVRVENRIHGSDQHSCLPGALPVMITGHVLPVGVPPDHAGSRVAAAIPA